MSFFEVVYRCELSIIGSNCILLFLDIADIVYKLLNG